jgi:hypothetical protein
MEDNDTQDEPLFAPVPEDLSTLTDEQLAALIAGYELAIADVTSNPLQFVTAEYTTANLLDETKAAIDTVKALKANQAARAETPAEPVELSDEEKAAFADLATAASETPEEPEPAEPEPVEPEAAVTASAPVVRGRLPRPSAERTPVEHQPTDKQVSLIASAGAPDRVPGSPFRSELDLAQAMIDRHRTFGAAGPDVVEKFTIGRYDWHNEYPEDRLLGQSIEANMNLVASVTSKSIIKTEFDRRKKMQLDGAPDALVASGGLCAPVTPYYNLQYISVPTRPVMGALPSFNADRGGLRYARPAALSAVTTGVGLITEAQDAAGGSSATKSCQTIPCPPFQETDVDIIYHCLQFGNLGARAFPELVAQWNNLVLAAHARLAESNLLTQIDAFSTQITAGSLGLGASATLFSQILAAANGLRNRNRMDPNAILRLMIPWWAVDLIVSDVIRGQFQRFDTDEAKVTALLRSFGIEPTYYIDGANGRGQVFGTQANGALLTFPPTVVWYLFPEASFLYLDGGVLELGIVRDSVLNSQNNMQLFGESFENVAYVGVESLAVETFVCDSGTVAAPVAVGTCPYSYQNHS